MREIKFRAWDSEPKTMWEWDEIFTLNSVELEELLKNEGYYSSPRWILMQFTGLKDKNGKEIYEGDIIQLNTTLYFTSSNGNEVFEVRYIAPQFSVFGKDGEEDSMYDSPIYEIIGNIYENPNLLIV